MMKRILAAVALAAMLAVPAAADDEHDHELARKAVEAGEIVPLRDILAVVERDFPGTMMEVELEREHGAWVYEIKMLSAGGEVTELVYDARTRQLLSERAPKNRHGRKGR